MSPGPPDRGKAVPAAGDSPFTLQRGTVLFEQSLKAPQDQVLAVPAAARTGSPSRFLAFLVASNTLLLYSPLSFLPGAREEVQIPGYHIPPGKLWLPQHELHISFSCQD